MSHELRKLRAEMRRRDDRQRRDLHRLRDELLHAVVALSYPPDELDPGPDRLTFRAQSLGIAEPRFTSHGWEPGPLQMGKVPHV